MARIFEQGLATSVGYALPLRPHAYGGETHWVSGAGSSASERCSCFRAIRRWVSACRSIRCPGRLRPTSTSSIGTRSDGRAASACRIGRFRASGSSVPAVENGHSALRGMQWLSLKRRVSRTWLRQDSVASAYGEGGFSAGRCRRWFRRSWRRFNDRDAGERPGDVSMRTTSQCAAPAVGQLRPRGLVRTALCVEAARRQAARVHAAGGPGRRLPAIWSPAVEHTADDVGHAGRRSKAIRPPHDYRLRTLQSSRPIRA